MAFRSQLLEASHYLFLVVLLCGGISALSNLDVSEPIVRMSPAPDEDSFGFAVVLHQVEEPVAGDFYSFINLTKMIIGAPQGTYPGGLSDLPMLQPELFSGLVYLCGVGSPGDCNGLLSEEINVSSNDRRLFDGDPNSLVPIPENKSEQLMGSFLTSNGKHFLACAPRWVTDPDVSDDIDARRPVGRCFVSPQNLQGFQLVQPCDGMASSNPGQTTTSNNQCLAGFSGAFVDTPSSEGLLALGVIGDSLFNGNYFYYTFNSTSVPRLSARTGSVPSTRITNLYDGYSTTVGFITNTQLEDVISGVPRFDGTVLSGGVRIRSQADLTVDSTINVTGTQTGEFFGFSVAAADLNNDGFDELIVGAPIYSDYDRNLQEIGQVYVFENTGGNLNSAPIILTRNRPLARFGTAVVNLEDVNGDGYEDIAVGAPYEANSDTGNTGAVYIYYGKSSAEGLISRIPDQVIRGDDIVTNVPDVQSVRTFGYSLFSGVDVDGNVVNDLLIGAYESKTAVLIRSLSVATVNVTVTANSEMIPFDTMGMNGSMFMISVCASYSGRGLEGRQLDAILEVSENVSNNVPRLFFIENDLTANRASVEFVFPSTNQVGCVDVPVFVKSVSQLSGQVDLSPLQVEVGFPAIPRRDPAFIGGNPVDLIDYRTIPILIVEGTNITSVVPSVNCPLDQNMQEVCSPDLTVTLLNVTYRDAQDNVISEGKAIAGIVQQSINIYLRYNNIGDDPAFGSVLTFSLPERLSYLRVDRSSSPEINCQLNERNLYNCDLPNYIPPGTEGTEIALVWRVPRDITGNEPDDFSNVNISLVSVRDQETNITNNDLINGPVRIEYAAIADLIISRIGFTIDPNTYRGVTATQNPVTVDEIGQTVQLTVTVRNGGPSTVTSADVNIFIPTNDEENIYYLYLFNVVNSGSAVVTCSREFLNPDGLAPPTGGNRKRRFARIPRQASETTPAPQAAIGANDEIRNCSSQRGFCTMLTCRISSLQAQASVTFNVEAYLDERFFQSATDPFVFVAYASVQNNLEFFEDPDLSNNQDISGIYRVDRIPSEDESFPIWIPIVCGIVAVILIILLFALLYFVGFFRRKKMEDTKEAEGDFAPPEDDNGKPAPEKPVITEAPIEPTHEEIGDTDDLQDGDTEKPDVDPEETSL